MSPCIKNISNLDFDLSRSFNVKSDGATRHPIYDFLFIFNINIGPRLLNIEEFKI